VQTEKLRVLLEFAGSGAVLVGLVFVGLELRQNTEAVQAATLQNQVDASTEYLMLIASDADLARVSFDALTDPSQLNDMDSYRYFMLVRARWIRMQNGYQQWSRGTLIEEDWANIERRICGSNVGDTAARYSASWADHRTALSENFVDFVESCWSDSR